MFTMLIFALSFKDCKCFWIFCWLIYYYKTLSLCPFELYHAPYSSHYVIVFSLLSCCSYVFPLLGDNQSVKFRGKMGIFYTHFILMFLCCLLYK